MFGLRTVGLVMVTVATGSLAACNSTAPLTQVEASCASASGNYNDAWGCVRGQYLSYDEYRARYLATGDAVAAQVNAGQISDAAARASLASGFSGRSGGRR